MAAAKGRRKLNTTLILGTIVMLGVLLVSLFHATNQIAVFLNLVGFAIVFGGLAGVILMMLPFDRLKALVLASWQCYISEVVSLSGIVHEFMVLAGEQKNSPLHMIKNHSDFTREVRRAVEVISTGLKMDEIEKIVRNDSEKMENLLLSNAGYLLTLSKVAPALGLVGTLMGMVVLLSNMGGNAGLEMVGPAMAIALCATLYGVTVANMVFVPLAEHIVFRAELYERVSKIVIEGTLMLKQGRHPVHMREVLRSLLTDYENKELDNLQVARGGDPRSKPGERRKDVA